MRTKDALICSCSFELPFLLRLRMAIELVLGRGVLHVETRTPTENVIGATPDGTDWDLRVDAWWDRLIDWWRFRKVEGYGEEPEIEQ